MKTNHQGNQRLILAKNAEAEAKKDQKNKGGGETNKWKPPFQDVHGHAWGEPFLAWGINFRLSKTTLY